ncbi:MAG: cation-transporting P-type ATPase [Candidatus Saccharibacteria bacterium]|nr:cation-transporting P-type ATPase [Candidatus Saccharibacteria bacterium]
MKASTKQVTTRVTQIALGLLIALEYVALRADFTSKQTVLLVLSLVCAVIPVALLLQLRAKVAPKVLKQAIRVTVATKSSQLLLVALSVMGLAVYHLAPGITFMQILVIDALLYFPVSMLAHEKTYHGFRHPLWRSPVGFGLIAALISYANYLFYYARHDLSPFYIDASLPMYHQATTVTLLTALLCGFVYILFERADHHEQFFTNHLHSNDKLLKAFGVSLVLFAAIAYLPWFQWIFSTLSLDVSDWASALLAAGVYSLCRLTQRHTRKHTRHVIVDLHLQSR